MLTMEGIVGAICPWNCKQLCHSNSVMMLTASFCSTWSGFIYLALLSIGFSVDTVQL